ncbi:MAG: CBS domain-containing protein [Gammaproteobacteria bacterium]|nr:CBS domain-containing protein [Gammaproteobacteria bacterium]
MKDTKIRELMNKKVATTSMDADPLEVATIMRNNRYSCIVVAESDVPLGIVTERDIVKAFVDYYGHEDGRKPEMKDIVTSPAITVKENTTIFDAMVLIESRKIRHLPVVNARGRLSGIVTYTDLVHNHQRLMDEHINIIEREVKDRTRELTEANDKLHAMSLEDHMLKIGNRRAMEVDLKYTHDAAMCYQR